MKKEEFDKLVDEYDANPSQETLEPLKAFLKRQIIYFKRYYTNTEGKSPVNLSNYRENGKFVDFTESTQYSIPSLLMVRKEDTEIVYVSLNDFTFE